MLIIEIALGIVLGVLIIKYWKQILGLGLNFLLIVGFVSVLAFTGYYVYSNLEAISPHIELVLFLAFPFVFIAVLIFFGNKVSAFTVAKWEVTSGDLLGFLLISVFFISGFELIPSVAGWGFLLVGTVFLALHARSVKCARDKRIEMKKIRESYSDSHD